VVIPLSTQHYLMLRRNLLYTELHGPGSWPCSSGNAGRWRSQ
jgi:hypothetical protein